MRKPRCFGDPDEHDPADRMCRNCKFQIVCGHIARTKAREDSRRPDRPSTPPPTTTPPRPGRDSRVAKTPDPEDYIERSEESVGFFGALFFNGALSGLRAALVEATFASDQIPRFQYPDPFRNAFKRDRREEEDEE